ncbi:hypothetical protein [Streptomyces tritici]|uniref:bestrophin-like domain n=1 Tax=Streptomyces tritici TaxID=2054410 RepID=UPI003AEF7528
MVQFLTIAAIAAALLAGLFAHAHRRREYAAADTEDGSVSDLISPLETLAVLLVAFVIVVAAESYGTASAAAETEASRIDHLYEVADYAPDPQRRQIQADAICYTRAVRAHEWPLMKDGGGASPKVSVWSSGLRSSFKQLSADPDERFTLLVQADDDRSEARHARIAEATPAIPPVVYWFMVVSLAATIGAFAFGLPRNRGPGHLTLLLTLAVLFTGSLLLIQDIDRPFDGVIRVTDSAMAETAADISDDFRRDHPGAGLPCDGEGNPRTSD